eukprot:symbB.v1.2.023696.t2/scaffold2189.1/size92612/6
MDCVSADSLTKVSSELPTETELRQLLQAFPRMMPKLIRRPRGCLALLRALLQHRLREKLFIADAFLELKGFSQCLKAWCHLLDDRLGAETMDDLRGKASEVILELLAQVRRLDNIEALSLALFVECFIGENLGSAVSGGFVMSSGQAVRRVVLSLLRSWSENLKALRALSPLLVGKLWASFASKLRRDAGSHVSREIQVPKGTKVKMEWFKLKPSQTLKKGFGAFHPEELASAVMQFLVAHFNATCSLVQVGPFHAIGTAVDWPSHFDSSHFCKLEPTIMEDPNALLWAVLYEGNLSILKKLTYELMDFRALHPKTGLTMLLYVIDRSFAQDSDGAYNYPGIEVIQWLLSMGADVTQKVSPESSCKPIKLWLVDYDDLWNSLGEYEVAIPFAGHSAISYIVELQRVLAENPHQDFEFEETFLQDFWAAIYRSLPAEEFSNVAKHRQEGQHQCIKISDTPSCAVSLFLELLYIAHSPKPPTVEILEVMISNETFPVIAEAASLKHLEKLKNSCRQFALKSKAVKQQLLEGSLPKAVEQLLGYATQDRSERGCEEDPEGILPRSPAEEWTQDVLDRPFGWGVLVPLMVSPPSVATDALKLLEFLVDRHPHQEIVAKRLAGLHSFMPLLSLPWPQADPVESHLPATLGVAMARRSAAKVLQCAMDTDFGMKVARDHLDLCLEGTLHLLHAVLDEPDVLVVMVELLGQLCGLDALQKLPEEWIFRRIHPSVVMVAMLIELRDRDGMMSTVPFHLFVFCHLAMESAAMILPATPAPYPKSVRWQPHKTVPEASLPLTTFERGTSCASGNGNFQRGTSSGLATTRSFGCEVEVRSYGPIHDRMKRRMYLQSFVRANGFKSLHTARGGGCWSGESLYPIHVAVMSGDLELVQMMLNEGVDTEKESSRGRTALDFAKKANVCGSHVEIIKLLEACEAMT